MNVSITVHCAREIPAESWLNEPKYEWFRKAYGYAATQTIAIPALSKCSPEEIYNVMWILARGANIELPKEP